MMIKILIKTAFYDDNQKNAFKKNYPKHFDDLEEFIKLDINEFNYPNFQVYFLFTRWRRGDSIWGNFNGIRTRVNDYWRTLNDFFKHDTETYRFNSVYPDNNEQTSDSEGIGVAGGLTVISAHHGLTEADWERIPISQHKDFDYEIASTGTSFIFLECKGTITSDNLTKSSAVYAHKAGIADKKRIQRPANLSAKDDIYYGVITVADPANHLRSWFVDPPAPETRDDPRKYKLLARLYFYYYNLNALYQHSSFVVALINRIKTLEVASNYIEFDKLPLIKANGEEYSGSTLFLQNFGIEQEYITALVFGKVVLIGEPNRNGQLLFFGFLREILDILTKQVIEDVLQYDTTIQQNRYSKIDRFLESADREGITIKVQVGINSPEAKFITTLRPDSKPHGSYLHLSCVIDLQISAAGRAFGLVRSDSIKPV